MSFAYFGSNGVYQISDTATTSAMQNINIANPYANMLSGGTINGLGSIGIGSLAAQSQAVAYQTNTQSLTQYLEQVSKPAKKAARGILAKLQEEIDGWHGDILERCPA